MSNEQPKGQYDKYSPFGGVIEGQKMPYKIVWRIAASLRLV